MWGFSTGVWGMLFSIPDNARDQCRPRIRDLFLKDRDQFRQIKLLQFLANAIARQVPE
jgi:hypothetical protein